MSEEEERALSLLQAYKNHKSTYYGYTWFRVEVKADDGYCKAVDVITNLINRLKKENKELQEIINGKAIQELGVSDFYREDK